MTDEVRAFICPQCGEPSKSNVHGVVETRDPEDPGTLGMEFALLCCGHCQTPIVQYREEDPWLDSYDGVKPAAYYPSPRLLSDAVPPALRDEFEEAQKCFDSKAYRATLVMVRRTLEGTCADQGSTKKTLAEGLKELQAQGRIDGLLAEWADLLRVVGNKGAHYGQTVSRDDAGDALHFAEALLDHLYVLRARFNAFQKRQQQRSNSEQKGS
ncbi:DUF4145 domain-containing protein [Nocardia salmonicida]|uniref:DUF4145 domain-containing protein n=1 Tax=Nocardia salmonicida TaxID=53431 RepID=UPI001042725F|nr:DUF4145 domain-containing protein [Nocardia salmonicida]